MNRIVFRIQKRKFSSNIIERGEESEGKTIWMPHIAPLCRKEEGDIVCDNLLKFLTETKYVCDCNNRLDQHINEKSLWICGDCDLPLKQNLKN